MVHQVQVEEKEKVFPEKRVPWFVITDVLAETFPNSLFHCWVDPEGNPICFLKRIKELLLFNKGRFILTYHMHVNNAQPSNF